MRKLLGAIAGLAALAAGCGSSDPAPSAAPEPAATQEAEQHAFEPGHSRAVREYYRHSADEEAHDNVEAEYHQPPRPATGGIGDTITLTGTNIGVRARVPPARRSNPPPPRRTRRPTTTSRPSTPSRRDRRPAASATPSP